MVLLAPTTILILYFFLCHRHSFPHDARCHVSLYRFLCPTVRHANVTVLCSCISHAGFLPVESAVCIPLSCYRLFIMELDDLLIVLQSLAEVEENDVDDEEETVTITEEYFPVAMAGYYSPKEVRMMQ